MANKIKDKPILDPDRELPAPHDMELEAGYDDELPSGSQKSTQKKKFPTRVLLLIVFVILILLAGGMYFLNAQKETTKVVPPTAPSPTVTPNPTANWKTYTAPDETFRFKYPSTLRLIATNNHTYNFLKDYTVNPEGTLLTFGHSITEDEKRLYWQKPPETITDFTLFYITGDFTKKIPYGDFVNAVDKGEIRKFLVDDSVPAQEFIWGCQAACVNIVFRKNETMFDFKQLNFSEKQLSTLRAVVSTFKLLPNTSDWKTYTNNLYKYQVKFPSALAPNNDIGDGENMRNVVFDYPEQYFGIPPYYISVQPYPSGKTRDISIYNSHAQLIIDKIFALKVGEELDQETTYAVGGKWDFKTRYKRLPDHITDHATFLVIENPEWYGGKNRRLYLKKNKNIFQTGITYKDDEELLKFNNFVESIKFIQ